MPFVGRLRAGGRTALFDAISQVAMRMGEHAGKKAILVLTDGGDNASVLDRQAAILRSQKVGIPIYAIASGAALSDREAEHLLHELAESTGGHLFKLHRSKEMESVFRSIVAEVEKSYLLAFQAPNDETASLSKWHQLQVLLKNTEKQLTVRTRSGYLVH